MAANDPTYGVPTPTGTLQGCAAFGWDGATWQPSARASVGVGTPTGVLRGVAPFTWSGSAWTPAGGGPDVAATGGVLDGVAVYTWSGSAWVPAGGPDTATPTGVLQGIAAFNWDGTAWQPSGQAGPDVVTPNGVLQGVAMFSWGGTGWAPTVAGVTVDINFLNTTSLDGRVTFSRGSAATYFDTTGTMQTAAANAPRFDYDPVTRSSRGLLIEESRTNVLLNTATLITQSVAVTAQAYTLSFYGTGTVTMSGAFAGSLVGTGAFPTRVQTTFTPAAGTLTCTVTGSVLSAQLEAGAFVTSYIPSGASATARNADVATIASIPGRNWPAETFAADYMLFTTQNSSSRLIGGAANTWGALYVGAGNTAGTFDGAGLVSTVNSATAGAVEKAASTWASPNVGQVCLNAGAIASTTTMTNGFNSMNPIKLMGDSAATDQTNGYIRRFRYWPRVLSNAEMQQVTT